MKYVHEDKSVEIKGLKGRHLKELIDLSIEIQESENPVEITKKYMTRIDQIAAEITNNTLEQFYDLPAELVEKVKQYIVERARNSSGFMSA